MLIVVSSPDVVAPNGSPRMDLVQVLIRAKANGNPVGIISNHSKPTWFDGCFSNSGVQFLQSAGRQSGTIISINAKKFSLNSQDVFVLAAKAEDVQMGKNGGAVLIAAGWSNDPQVKGLGICIDSAAELETVLNLSSGWPGHWWLDGNEPLYRIRTLADLSGYGKDITQQEFARKLTNTVKQGGGCLKALLAITARSLLIDGVGSESDLVWGVFPSSGSSNNDNETLSDFTHRLRTTVSRVRNAKRGEPLFIRHKSSPKRSAGGGGIRTDPSSQIETIHLNPYYKKKGNLSGRHVIVVDDCVTYGVSFGTAAAFLRKAGAAKVTGVALGKFGNQLSYYQIGINSDPFAPVGPADYNVDSFRHFNGATSGNVQRTLRDLIP